MHRVEKGQGEGPKDQDRQPGGQGRGEVIAFAEILAGELGRKEESATYARKGAALAPSDGYMWLQLARAEKSLGHTDATLNAIAKAAQVSPDSGSMLAVLGFSYINLNRIP